MVSTVSSSRSVSRPFDAASLSDLRSNVQGDILLPGEPGFDEALSSWALMVHHAPYLAVMPETASDVARVVGFAHSHGLPVGVLGTGHGTDVPCVDGILINTSRMQGVTIDPVKRTARVEAGVRWGSVIPIAHQHGLAPLNGSSATVGVVGYTLGGGHGWLARKYGRASERVLAVDLVTATGELRHVTQETDPDLFWAIKGSAGNFGIVTALEFELVPVDRVFGGAVMYPLAEAEHVFTEFSRWTRSLPDDVTASIGIMRLPPIPDLPPMLQGAQLVVIRACAVGDLDAGEALIAPMRALGTPIMDTFAVMPYSEVASISMDPESPMPAMGASMILSDLDETTIETLMALAGPGVDSPLLMLDIRDLRASSVHANGAHEVSRTKVDGLLLFAVGIAMNAEMGQLLEGALAELRETLRPFATDRAMMNFMGDGNYGKHQTEAAFQKGDYPRMQEMKRRYDPENRFRFNHNITPAQDA